MEIGSGNLLTADVDALVNTVNTVGVMGKGIALQFKRAYPANYAAYRRACEQGQVQLGSVFVFDTAVKGPRRWIVNFPTKGHWRADSQLSDVAAGLDDLVRVLPELGVRSVAVPALGCGNGGLDWADVRPLIEAAAARLPSVRFVVFPPAGAPSPSSMPIATAPPQLTRLRALLVASADAYLARARIQEVRAGVSELELHKLGYFLQRLDGGSRWGFARGRYGPYSEDLTHELAAMEGHFLTGLGDRTTPVTELAPVTPVPAAVDDARALVAGVPRDGALVDRLLRLLDGFETPYSVELLATVDFAARQTPTTADASALARRVADWNLRKRRLFTADHVAAAAARLEAHGMLPVALLPA